MEAYEKIHLPFQGVQFKTRDVSFGHLTLAGESSSEMVGAPLVALIPLVWESSDFELGTHECAASAINRNVEQVAGSLIRDSVNPRTMQKATPPTRNKYSGFMVRRNVMAE